MECLRFSTFTPGTPTTSAVTTESTTTTESPVPVNAQAPAQAAPSEAETTQTVPTVGELRDAPSAVCDENK